MPGAEPPARLLTYIRSVFTIRPMPLLNVRLDPDDAKKAAELRAAGVMVSNVVRAAIRREHARLVGGRSGSQRPSDFVREVIASTPDDDASSERAVDARDRKAVARHIAAKLRATRG